MSFIMVKNTFHKFSWMNVCKNYLNRKGHDYRINFWFKTEFEAVGRMKNFDQSEKSGQLSSWKNHYLI